MHREKEVFTKDKLVSVIALFTPHKMIQPITIITNEIEMKINHIQDIHVIHENSILAYKYIVETENKTIELYFDTFSNVWYIK